MTGVTDDSEELHAGMAIGPYDLLAPIGVGGMARVWAARVRGQADIVALKMLLPELAGNIEFRKMFVDEARIASRVRHPNVCSTFEMGEQAGTLYLAMEWLDGPSLVRVLRPGRGDVTECERIPLRPRIAARIVADACAGLHAAHELVDDNGRSLAVVHRDVSPHNLLMTADGVVKITDFGVAKALGKSHMTIAGQLKGKLAYMAPEQLTGDAIDRRSDVFALGCVLYEITTGHRPFKGEHDPQVMTSIIMGRYEPPSALMAGYPHELSIIVMRALANGPDNRYPSAQAMQQALEAFLRSSGPPVGPPQVAALLAERCGPEMETRANAVRGGTPQRPSGPRQLAPARENANPATTTRDGARAPSGRGLLWVAAAAMVGAGLGIGVLSQLRAAKRAKAASAAAASAAVVSAAASAAVLGSARVLETSVVPIAPSDASDVAARAFAGRVHLIVKPPTAVIIVDDVVLPRGADTVMKPEDGGTMNVLVRADRYQDMIVLVDSASPEEILVALDPAVTRPPRTGAVPGAAKDSAAGEIRTPPNPYD